MAKDGEILLTIQKCATDGCLRAAQKNALLCVRCVQWGHGSSEDKSVSPTQFEKTEKFTLTDTGEEFPPLSEEGYAGSNLTERNMRATKNLEEEKSLAVLPTESKTKRQATPIGETVGVNSPPWPEEFIIPKEWQPSEKMKNEMRNSAGGITYEEPRDLQRSTQGETAETQPGSLTVPLLTSEQESYVSTALVDDSIRRLHLQMKRLTYDPQNPDVSPPKTVDFDDDRETTRAKLACATATSMARLLKTKLDAARLFRKQE